MSVKSSYDEDSIKILENVKHIRTRPSMYLDSSRPTYHMFQEILDNSTDELMNGFATMISVDIDYEENRFSVRDDGRGIPQGINKEKNLPTPQVIYTTLNSGGKYDTMNYTCSAGTNGVGSVCVNALSREFIVHTWRGKDLAVLSCSYGEVSSYENRKVKQGTKSGTMVFCTPDTEHKFVFDRLSDYKSEVEDRLYLLKSLFPKASIFYNGKEIETRPFSSFIKESLSPLLEKAILLTEDNLFVSMNWSTENNKYQSKCFCNSLYNPNGGDHDKGVYDAVINVFGNTDYSLGISFAVSVLYPDVTYDTQVKLKASSKELRAFVRDKVSSLLLKYLKENPEVKEKIDELIKQKRRAIDKKNNKSNIVRSRRSSFLSVLGTSKFSDCSTKNREDAELYIVEGDSAAGSAIQARDISTQAILPIRGKIINALNADVASLFKNSEVSTIMSSINIGTFDEVDISKSRYGKVIIFADADEDGKNISVLLLSLFISMTHELVDAGMLYLALPPLYGTHSKGAFIPIHTEEDKQSYLDKGYEIQRYKGLGEMSPSQLRAACMDPSTRRLVQIRTTSDCYDIVRNIVGGSSKYRKELLRKVGVLYE